LGKKRKKSQKEEKPAGQAKEAPPTATAQHNGFSQGFNHITFLCILSHLLSATPNPGTSLEHLAVDKARIYSITHLSASSTALSESQLINIS